MQERRLVALCALATSLLAVILLAGRVGEDPTELEQQSTVKHWLQTLKGAESFLDDADKGKLPARGIVPQSLTSVEDMLKKTKEQVHREATRLNALREPAEGVGEAGPKMPYGARKVEVAMGEGERNSEGGFLGLARRDVRPGEVMREVSDMVDTYKAEEDKAAESLLREIAGKIVEAFDAHGLSAAQIARSITDGMDTAEAEQQAAAQGGGAPPEGAGALGVEGQGEAAEKEEKAPSMPIGQVSKQTLMGQEGPDVGIADCTDLPGLPKSSKFCLEGRPASKLPGLDAAMTTGDMRAKIDELKKQARANMGLPNANKIDQEELAKLQDIVGMTSKALNEQEKKLREIKAEKKSAMSDLHAQKRVMQMAVKARQQRLSWRHMDAGLTEAYKDAGFQLPLSAGR